MTLGEWRETIQHKLRSMFIIGGNETGQSSLMRALAKLFCVRANRSEYAFLKALDPVGLMTRSGEVSTMACFVFTDFMMRSLKDECLQEESIKALLDPGEPASYPARYHVAQLPKHRPRMFAVNAGKDINGETDFGWWFNQQMYCEPLTALARGDRRELSTMSDAQQAVARRTVVFCISNRDQIGLKTASGVQSLEQDFKVELAREREYMHACSSTD